MTDAALPELIPAKASNRGDAMRNALRCMQAGLEEETESWLRAIVDDEGGLNEAWMALGVFMQSVENMERQACRAFVRAIELNRAEPMSWAALASTLDELGHTADAEAAFRQALVHDPEHPMSLLGLAGIMRREPARRDDALGILHDLIELDPEAAAAWDLLGTIMEEDLGDLQGAEIAWRRSLAIDPTDYEIWDRLGRLLERKFKDRWGALRLYNQSVKFGCAFASRTIRLSAAITLRGLIVPPLLSALLTKAADNANNGKRYQAMRFWARLARIVWPWRTRPLCQLGMAAQYGFAEYDKAERAYRKAIAREPRNEWPWRLLGILLVDIRRDYDQGAAVLERATLLDPFNSYCWSLLGNCYEHRGELDKAEQAIRRAVELDETNPTSWIFLGEHFAVRRGDTTEAIRNYERALQVDPQYTDGWVCKGTALMSGAKDFAEAEKCFRRAIEISPNAANAWRCLGTLLYKHLDRLDEAEECLRISIGLEADARSAKVHLAVLLFSRKGAFDEADVILRDLVDRRAYLQRALAALLHLHAARGDHEKGRALAEEILAERPNDFDILNHLAWTVHEERLAPLYGAAEEWSRRAVELQPGVMPILHTLTELLFDRGRAEEALAEAEPLYEAVLARRFPASDVRDSLRRAADGGSEKAAFWLEKINSLCD